MKNLCSPPKEGFTLVEVVIAIFFTGMLLTSIFSLLDFSIRSTYESDSIISRFFYLKNNFVDKDTNSKLLKDPKFVLKKEIKEPSAQITFKATKPKNKTLEKRFKNIYILDSEAKWSGLNEQDYNLYGLKMIPEKREEK